jgi:endonuclease/exonuclease/phosphatase (EEP) superfamily protein YafD
VLRILFWNLNKKDLRRHVCDAAKAVSADVIILIEAGETSANTLNLLQSSVSSTFCHPASVINRFQIFSRDLTLDLSEIYSGDRVSLRRLSYAGTELMLGAVHVVDRWNWDQQNQSAQVGLLAAEIQRQENVLGHDHTVLIGDFNMNPFDQTMNMATGMNALMTAKCVERGSRTLQEREYRFFYNPMWSLFGDRTPGPSGTYYHACSSQGIYGWNMLDQVLLRCSAIPLFDSVCILTSAGATPLLTRAGRPNKKTASNHFPILVTLK